MTDEYENWLAEVEVARFKAGLHGVGKMVDLELIEAQRPGTEEEDDAYFAAAFRGALERICVALRIPGSPDLIESVPAEVERRLGVFGTETTFSLLAQVVDDRTLDLGEVVVNTGAAPRNQSQFKGPLSNYEKGTVLWVTVEAKSQDDHVDASRSAFNALRLGWWRRIWNLLGRLVRKGLNPDG